jgi:hypothetical protein
MLKQYKSPIMVGICTFLGLFLITLNVILASFSFLYLLFFICSLVGVTVMISAIHEEFQNAN